MPHDHADATRFRRRRRTKPPPAPWTTSSPGRAEGGIARTGAARASRVEVGTLGRAAPRGLRLEAGAGSTGWGEVCTPSSVADGAPRSATIPRTARGSTIDASGNASAVGSASSNCAGAPSRALGRRGEGLVARDPSAVRGARVAGTLLLPRCSSSASANATRTAPSTPSVRSRTNRSSVERRGARGVLTSTNPLLPRSSFLRPWIDRGTLAALHDLALGRPTPCP
jgi:hypothetical protein